MKHYLLLTGLIVFSAPLAAETSSSQRQGEVFQRTQQATSYDLNKTLQTFTQTVHGGVQHVIAKSANDKEQIKLIRDNLRKMADDFRKGDFSETERIHGADMPGLAQLKRAQLDDIKYEYETLENGAQIHYSSEYPQYIEALREWIEAQAIDHNNDVSNEHSQHHQTMRE